MGVYLLMRILFVSPRPFGLMGTPGTYHLVEAYARQAQVRVIANSADDGNLAIVHTPAATLDLHKVHFDTDGYLEEIAKISTDFRPDIVCVTNYARWYQVVEHLKQIWPRAKYVLDIKSPSILNRDSVKKAGAQKAKLLDLIVTRCSEDIETWIPGCSRPYEIYPLGLRLSQFTPRKPDADTIRCKRFVFIGSYSKHRELDKLLRFIAELPVSVQAEITFDMVGSGPVKEELQSLVKQLDLDDIVKINDALSQEDLFARLPTYDAGVAWVPRNVFDTAPSLKMLEYFASGLVTVASATTAHKRNIEEGYEAVLFDETPQAFAQAMEMLVSKGVPSGTVEKNLSLVRSRDWDSVVSQHLLPAFDALLPKRAPPETQTEPPAVTRDGAAAELHPAPVAEGDDVFSRMLFWSPVADTPKLKMRPPSQLRVACILGPRLFDGLAGEVQLQLMTRKTWEPALRYGRPDMLLIESTWFTSTGEWHMAQSSPGADRDAIEAMVKLARELGIPTIFWMTVDSQYHDLFKEFARNFDVIFCADQASIGAFAKDGRKATLLEPAFQPRRFNPIKSHKRGGASKSSALSMTAGPTSTSGLESGRCFHASGQMS